MEAVEFSYGFLSCLGSSFPVCINLWSGIVVFYILIFSILINWSLSMSGWSVSILYFEVILVLFFLNSDYQMLLVVNRMKMTLIN